MTKNSIPGVVVGISIKGKNIWVEGLGQTDVENEVKTDKQSVWRLASISKPLTTALVAQLIEKKVLDLDTNINTYLPLNLFPIKTFDNIVVNISLRQLLSHTAGLHSTKLPDDVFNNKIYKASNVSQTIEYFKD